MENPEFFQGGYYNTQFTPEKRHSDTKTGGGGGGGGDHFIIDDLLNYPNDDAVVADGGVPPPSRWLTAATPHFLADFPAIWVAGAWLTLTSLTTSASRTTI
ncbi:hypothetical protein CsSME_00044186 [Camellia sinensis var. sinensis]